MTGKVYSSCSGLLILDRTQIPRASFTAQLVKNLRAMQETPVQSLGWEDSPGEGNSYPLQYSGLENSIDCNSPQGPKSRIQLSDFHFHFQIPG